MAAAFRRDHVVIGAAVVECGGVGDVEPAESSECADLPLALKRPSQAYDDVDEADDECECEAADEVVADDEVDDLLSSSTV